MKLVSVIIIAVFALNVSCKEQSLEDSPLQTIIDPSVILNNGTEITCSKARTNSSVTYWLFSRQVGDYVEIKNFHVIDFSKPIKILLHPWRGNRTTDTNTVILNAYLQRNIPINIIALDYSKFVDGPFDIAYCNLPTVALYFAKFLCKLTEFVTLDKIHIVAHCIGAHLAGIAGTFTQAMCGSVGRISGLDPVGPIYQDVEPLLRLDKGDALFVDVIHTGQDHLGYIGDLGHIDFYVNDAHGQPECLKRYPRVGITQDHLREFRVCNHHKSAAYFAESINHNRFYATSCSVRKNLVYYEDLIHPDHTYMGESCKSAKERQQYCLNTASQSFFSLGPERLEEEEASLN